MPTLIRKLFQKSEAPKDGLTQPQREAIVDLLNYCMYVDNLILPRGGQVDCGYGREVQLGPESTVRSVRREID
jgi:hypothetical protein